MNAIVQNVLRAVPLEQLVDPLVSDIRWRTDFTTEKSLLNSQEIVDIIRDKPVPPGVPPSMGKQILKLIKPTFIIKSKAFGDKVIAPYGESDPVSASIWKNRIGLLLVTTTVVLVGTGFALGRLSKR